MSWSGGKGGLVTKKGVPRCAMQRWSRLCQVFAMIVELTEQDGRPQKTKFADIKDYTKSFGSSWDNAQVWSKWHRNRLGQRANKGAWGNWPLTGTQWRPKTQRRSEDRELNQARSEPNIVDQPVRTLIHLCTIIIVYNTGTRYTIPVTGNGRSYLSGIYTVTW